LRPASTPRTPPRPLLAQASQGSGKQNTATVTRITELGRSGLSVVDIDRTLHREQASAANRALLPPLM